MAKEYMVIIDRKDGKQMEILWGPTCEDDCRCFIAGWKEGWKEGIMESGIGEEVACWELFIAEVHA